jgi:hypothetical protein
MPAGRPVELGRGGRRSAAEEHRDEREHEQTAAGAGRHEEGEQVGPRANSRAGAALACSISAAL